MLLNVPKTLQFGNKTLSVKKLIFYVHSELETGGISSIACVPLIAY